MSTAAPHGHLEAAQAWLAQDPDPETRAELAALIARAEQADAGAAADLDDRFGTRLVFGTAGLRGALGAGPNRMNRVLVAQAAAGLGAYLLAHAEHPLVVIGWDGRRNSDVFARDTAEILAGAGLRALLLPRLLPTPVLAFAVRHLGAAAGVMVTASHNPPADNGYKVYLGAAGGSDVDGAQIVPPADALIAAEIDRVARGDIRELPRSSDYGEAGEDVVDAYVVATAAVAPAPPSSLGMTWAYTAMHGVGWQTAHRVIAAAGYPSPATVAAQLEPDPAFPTVAFPNPEEPGAMDLVFAAATQAGAEFAIANDPDADRLAVGVPDGSGGWRRLSGNEVGLLLGWRAARTAGGEGALACSLVSSPALGVVAARYGLGFVTTLTGFKWISRASGIRYGFEEALGYLVDPDVVRDKDGISALVAVLGLAAEARADGRTLGDLLDDFAAEFGWFASGQLSVRVDDLDVIAATMARLRAEPPAAVGAVAVARIDDLLAGADGLPPGDVLRLHLADGSRMIVRPSGTEPKLKVYLDVEGSSRDDAAARLAALEHGARALIAEPAASARPADPGATGATDR